MLRKLCTTAVVTAALAAGSLGLAGTANAAEPVHNVAADRHNGGIGGLGGGLCTVVGGVLSGVGCPGSGHNVGGDFHGRWRGGHWDGGRQTIILNGSSYGVGDCGCGDNQVLLTPVVSNQVQYVPLGAVAAGDGSCASFVNRGFSYFGSNRRVHWRF
jgi:hypothetical protein